MAADIKKFDKLVAPYQKETGKLSALQAKGKDPKAIARQQTAVTKVYTDGQVLGKALMMQGELTAAKLYSSFPVVRASDGSYRPATTATKFRPSELATPPAGTSSSDVPSTDGVTPDGAQLSLESTPTEASAMPLGKIAVGLLAVVGIGLAVKKYRG